MKYLLLLFLFSANSKQTVLYNTPTEQFYIVDVNTDPIQILVIEENIEVNISCINDKLYNLQDINFTNNSACLFETLNNAYKLNIQEFVDLKNLYTKDELLQLKDSGIVSILKAISSISHSYTIPELYQIYTNANKNEFHNEIHYFTYLKINDTYVPLAYPA